MVLRHVSIFKDHPQGVCLYLAKVTELFKRFEEFFKFKTLNLKSRWLVDSPTHGTTRVTTHTCYSITATTPDLTIEILNSVF